MKIRFVDLWTWEGTINRGPYALIGLLGFAVKHNLDRLVAALFHRPWGIFNYWIPPERILHPSSLSRADARFLAAMVALALPFIWVGVVQTLRRLRSAGLPQWIVALFFLPFLNLAFFLLLCLVPSRGEVEEMRRPGARKKTLGVYLPQSEAGSAAVAVFLTVVLGFGLGWLGVQALGTYGWSLFLAVPFCLGLFASLIYGYHEPRRLGRCFLVATVAILFLAGAFVAFAFEGVICVFMALPLAIPLSLMGAAVGYWIQRRPAGALQASAVLFFAVLVSPLLMGAEAAGPQVPPVFQVRTSLEINAPPEVVWRYLVSFPRLGAPAELPFRLGVAYPLQSTLQGEGIGAHRECLFSSGAFAEPIIGWEKNRRLKFSIAGEPLLMREMSPYREIHTRHLDDHYFQPKDAEFTLTPLPGGRTLLQGTSEYTNRMWPSLYWRMWTDAILHDIHSRVFRHIKSLAEADQAAAAAGSSR